jgi:hypothetical protein
MESQTHKDSFQTSNDVVVDPESEPEKVLCSHCLRNAKNGVKCKGIYVIDEYY